MTYTANQPKPLYDAIIARLQTQTGKQIGLGRAPDDVTTPYAVVYPLPDIASTGSLDDPDSDVWWSFQVTANGSDMNEALWMQGRCRTALLGWTPSVAGYSCGRVELAEGSGGLPDRALGEQLDFTTDRFRLFTSPT